MAEKFQKSVAIYRWFLPLSELDNSTKLAISKKLKVGIFSNIDFRSIQFSNFQVLTTNQQPTTNN